MIPQTTLRICFYLGLLVNGSNVRKQVHDFISLNNTMI